MSQKHISSPHETQSNPPREHPGFPGQPVSLPVGQARKTHHILVEGETHPSPATTQTQALRASRLSVPPVYIGYPNIPGGKSFPGHRSRAHAGERNRSIPVGMPARIHCVPILASPTRQSMRWSAMADEASTGTSPTSSARRAVGVKPVG